MNRGHGHVFERADKVRVRCGGPLVCGVCMRDFVRKQSFLEAERRHAFNQIADAAEKHDHREGEYSESYRDDSYMDSFVS